MEKKKLEKIKKHLKTSIELKSMDEGVPGIGAMPKKKKKKTFNVGEKEIEDMVTDYYKSKSSDTNLITDQIKEVNQKIDVLTEKFNQLIKSKYHDD